MNTADIVTLISLLNQSVLKGYLSQRQTAKAQASLYILAVLPESLLFTHMTKGVGYLALLEATAQHWASLILRQGSVQYRQTLKTYITLLLLIIVWCVLK